MADHAFIPLLGQSTGLDEAALHDVATIAIRALGARLGPDATTSVDRVLPSGFGAALGSPVFMPPAELDDVYKLAAEEAGLRVSVALVAVQAVYREIGSRLGDRGRAQLRDRVPPVWAELLCG